MREHLLRHFVRRRRPHEGASKNRCEQGTSHEAGQKNEDRVKNDAANAHFIHSRNLRAEPNPPLALPDRTGCGRPRVGRFPRSRSE